MYGHLVCFTAGHNSGVSEGCVTSQAAWSKARDSSGYPDGTATILAVEVLSLSNRKKAVREKTDLYLAYGIEVCVVNPKSLEIELFRGDEVLSSRLPNDKTLPLPMLLGSKPATLAHIFDLP